MTDRRAEGAGEVPLSWFGRTLWKFTPLYVELVFLAICLRLIGLVREASTSHPVNDWSVPLTV